MLAAVYFMQPVGQLLAQLVGLWVVIGYNNVYDLQNCTDQATCVSHVDSIWRWVAGVGAIPALVAIYYRFRIKDPGLYDLDVKNQGDRAVKNTEGLYRYITNNRAPPAIEMRSMNGENDGDPPLPTQFSWDDIYSYFWDQGNWRYLLGTSLCWFLLDL
jgi:MFS transporter, PHS family, inorganic phosphate transporter